MSSFISDWSQFKNFSPEEFDQDRGNKHGMFLPGSGNFMKLSHIEKEQKIRTACEKLLGPEFKTIITDGFRTPEYNQKIGGAPKSAHLMGYAADRRRTNPTHAYYEVKFALEYGMTGIGIKIAGPKEGRFIHLDSSEDEESRPNIWTYEVEKNYNTIPEEAVRCHGKKAYSILKSAMDKGFTLILVKQGLGTPLESRWIVATNEAPRSAPVLMSV